MTKRFRVWWKPNVAMCGVIYIPVESVTTGVDIINALANYDLFLSDNDLMDDFTNVGGLQQTISGDDTDWEDWEDEKTGITDPEEWLEQAGKTISAPEECCRSFHR